MVQEPTASLSPNDPPASQTVITEDQVKQMEKIWLSRMEKLERRLMQSVSGERRARDQIALIVEEKDRRIAALERQVDMLEANDFHLSKTIHTLEQLERVVSAHFHSTVVGFHRLHSGTVARNDTAGFSVLVFLMFDLKIQIVLFSLHATQCGHGR